MCCRRNRMTATTTTTTTTATKNPHNHSSTSELPSSPPYTFTAPDQQKQTLPNTNLHGLTSPTNTAPRHRCCGRGRPGTSSYYPHNDRSSCHIGGSLITLVLRKIAERRAARCQTAADGAIGNWDEYQKRGYAAEEVAEMEAESFHGQGDFEGRDVLLNRESGWDVAELPSYKDTMKSG